MAAPKRKEFQVVLLAGGEGERLFPLSVGTPKALLPVANRPMILYALNMIERNGFHEVLIVASECNASAIRTFLNKVYQGKLKTSVHVTSDEAGTADALKVIRTKIYTDFVLLTSDLIADLTISDLIDTHRKYDATVTCLFKTRDVAKDFDPKLSRKLPRQLQDFEKDYVGYESTRKDPQRRLVLLQASDDTDDALMLKKAMLKLAPSVTLRGDLCDPHVYMFSPWIFDFMDQTKSSGSIRRDVLPRLLRHQNKAKRPTAGPLSEEDADVVNMLMRTQPPREKLPVCMAYVVEEGGFGKRANSLAKYSECNVEMSRGIMELPPMEEQAKHNFKKTQVGGDCLVDGHVKLGDASVVKKSTIGSHCQIGNNVKIVNSIILDHVNIADNVSLSSCVVGSDVEIQESCTLTQCQIGKGYIVEAGMDIKNDMLCFERE